MAGEMLPVVVLNRVDGEQPTDGEDMVMEIDPMDLLEVEIGDEGEEERGGKDQIDPDNHEPEKVKNEDEPTFAGGDEGHCDPLEIIPFDGGDESMKTADRKDTTLEEK